MTHKFTLLERITNILLLNASFIDNLGLMHGKMGICIFFYHLARKTNNKIYEDYAGELLDEITEEINDQTPWDFENGLAGIGWGVEYLVQNGFVDGDTNEVLSEFDNKLFRELNFTPHAETGLLNGIPGIVAYYLMRIKNPASGDENVTLLTNKHILIESIDQLHKAIKIPYKLITEPNENKQAKAPLDSLLSNENKITSESTATSKSERQNICDRNIFEKQQYFDITWELPWLLYLLAELVELNLYNNKVTDMLRRLLNFFNQQEFISRKYPYMLLLLLSLERLRIAFKASGDSYCDIQSQRNNIIYDLNEIYETIRDSINKESYDGQTDTKGICIRDGWSGIELIYNILYYLTKNPYYMDKNKCIDNSEFILENFDDTLVKLNLKYNNKTDKDSNNGILTKKPELGLLEGISGVGLLLIK